uniref:Uncharacterized protein MANES_03G177700 n=1 Tax=Rhizophora mucronata TaxID=61149 RepID=A0A2P2QNU5_RHIMU
MHKHSVPTCHHIILFYFLQLVHNTLELMPQSGGASKAYSSRLATSNPLPSGSKKKTCLTFPSGRVVRQVSIPLSWRTWTKESKLGTEKEMWWPRVIWVGSRTADVALYGPSGSLKEGFLSIKWRVKDWGRFSHIALIPANFGASVSSNPNTSL